MQKTNVATIFIGLGGTGKDAIRQIKESFRQKLICDERTGNPPHTVFLELDADPHSCGRGQAINISEYVPLWVAGQEAILLPEMRPILPEYVRSWLSPELASPAIPMGAGGIRQIGRFQLFQHVQEFQSRFRTAVATATEILPGEEDDIRQVDIAICTSLCGGTGSAILLDVAYMVKQWLQEFFPDRGFEVTTYAYTMMPDAFICEGRYTNAAAMEQMNANAYVALKELDYWMRPGSKPAHIQKYSDEIAVDWSELGHPFDIVFPLSGMDQNGLLILQPYSVSLDRMADMMVRLYAADIGHLSSFRMFMHNRLEALRNLANEHPEACGSFSSFGISTTESANEMAVHLGMIKAIERMMDIPLVDEHNNPCTQGVYTEDTSGAPIMPHPYYENEKNRQRLYRELFGDKLIFPSTIWNEDGAFKAWLEAEADKFRDISPYISNITAPAGAPPPIILSVMRAVGTVEQQGSWMFNAQTMAAHLYAAEKANFKNIVRNAIRNPVIGPANLLSMLTTYLIPRLENIIAKLDDDACWAAAKTHHAETDVRSLNDRLANMGTLEWLAAKVFPNRIIDNYRDIERLTVQAQRTYCYCTRRLEHMKMLREDVCRCADKLQYMLFSLKDISAESAEKLAASPEQLIAANTLQAYFLQNPAVISSALDQARSNICHQLADFVAADNENDLPRTESERSDYLAGLRRIAENSLEPLAAALQLDIPDWIVNAMQPDPAQQLHCVSLLCSQMGELARPALAHYAAPTDGIRHSFVSVSGLSTVLADGLQLLCAGRTDIALYPHSNTTYAMWANLHLGLKLHTLHQLPNLQLAYTQLLASPVPATAGLYVENSWQTVSE